VGHYLKVTVPQFQALPVVTVTQFETLSPI